MVNEMDCFVERLGSPGRYQLLISALIVVNVMVLAFHNLNMVFLGHIPPHHCKLSANYSSWSLNESIPTTIDVLTKQIKFESCKRYVDPSDHSLGTEECKDGWQYNYNDGEWSIVGEWDLVCNRKYLINLVTTAYFGGTLLGSPIFGYAADKYGRKPVMLGTLYAHIVVGILQFFSQSYPMFLGLKVVHGMLMQGMINAAHALNLELFRARHRTEAMIVGSMMWSFGQVFLTLISYTFRSWRYIYLALTLPSIITISYIWIFSESLRWLLCNGKVDKASKVVARIAKFNKIDMGNNVDQELDMLAKQLTKSAEGTTRKYDFRDLFRSPILRKITLLQIYMWFAASLVYYGLSYSVPSLGGNKYINFVISAGIEIISRLFLYPALIKLGRRTPNCVSFIASGILCIASVTLSSFGKGDTINYQLIAIGCAVVGKATCSISFSCVILLASEVFPTVIRSIALSICSVSSRAGGMSAPQILTLGDYTHKMVPLSLFGVAAIIAGLVTLMMPETLNVPLPDTIEDTEILGKKKIKKDEETNSKETYFMKAIEVPNGSGLENKGYEKE